MRVKRGKTALKKAKKVRKLSKGYRGARSRRYKDAKEAIMHALMYSFIDRRKKKRDFRRLWITRISAALYNTKINYSAFIKMLKNANIKLNRKMLSQIAVLDPKMFNKIVDIVRLDKVEA